MIEIKIQETRDNMIKVLNESGLPGGVISLLLKDLLNTVNVSVIEQISKAKAEQMQSETIKEQ